MNILILKILMPSSDCTILAPILARRQVLRNRRQMPEITGKSVLVHASDNHAVWMSKDAIWENHRRVADAREIFGMLNIWDCRQFKILLCEKCSDWKLHRRWPTANERADTEQRGVRGGVIDQNICILIDIFTIISNRNKVAYILLDQQHIAKLFLYPQLSL